VSVVTVPLTKLTAWSHRSLSFQLHTIDKCCKSSIVTQRDQYLVFS